MRYYSVTFKTPLVWMYNEKSSVMKENDDLEADKTAAKTALEQLERELSDIEGVKKAEVSQEGHVVGIEADEEDFPAVMNKVINIYRRFDDSSNVTYDFQMNMA